MQDAVDFDHIFTYAVNYELGAACKYQLTSPRFAATSPAIRKLNKSANGVIDAESYISGCFRAITLADVVTDVGQVPSRRLRPPDTHQLGYRL
jgi:hypothetical protein